MTKDKGGRPSLYSEELSLTICSRMAAGESLRKICSDDDMPNRATVHLWLLTKEHKGFFDRYEESCRIRAENMFDELEEIADSTEKDNVQRDRLRTDVRKWKLSKMLPARYGDKIDVTSDGEQIQPVLVKFIDAKDNGDTDGV